MLAIRGAFSRFFAESGFFLAAGLAFFFLICCIPMTLLGVSTLGFVLSTERASYVTGTAIQVDGGLVRGLL